MINALIAKRLVTYLLVSLIFLVAGYFLVYAAINPIIKQVLNVYRMFSFSVVPSADEVPPNIFNPSMLLTLPSGDTGLTGDPSETPLDTVEAPEETVKASEIEFPRVGTLYAQLTVPDIGIKVDVYFGDGKAQLKRGVGHYVGSSFPGEGSTILLAGHNTKEFNAFKNATIGMKVYYVTNYGIYTYEITEMQPFRHNDTSAYDLAATEETLVMYTCYPFDTFGLTPNRMFIYCKKVSGPRIINE